MPQVIVLGSGVIGLTSAIRLAESGYSVSIVARDLPQDSESQAFASPWAGANWHSFVTGEDERQCKWETVTFRKVWKELIPMGLAMKLECVDYFDKKPEPFWFKDLCPDYRELTHSELPPNVSHGVTFSTWSVDAPRYIQWLQTQLKERYNVQFTRATVESIDDVLAHSRAQSGEDIVIVNASGLGARTLGGVEDAAVHPIRGQTVLVWAPHFKRTTVGLKAGQSTYIIPRPGGHVILGGTFDVDSSDLAVNSDTTRGILERCYALEPSLAYDAARGIDAIPVVRVNVGLRPGRTGGARLEREEVQVGGGKKVNVVHAYGIGPAGYQASWGMAEDVLELVKGALQLS